MAEPAEFEPVIGLEIHTELQTRSKMFCACPVVDVTLAEPNSAVCPVCAGMPGVLPVVNRRAVEYALRVALALECDISDTSIFARKNYFYPDLPKGYQISQYEHPLARNGRLVIQTSDGERTIRIRRVHMEEDTGKLTHVTRPGEAFSLVDLNRAGVPLLEIVSEPDLHSAADVRAYAEALRSLLRYVGVNSGDMQKGVLRIEPNVSVRPLGSSTFGTRAEIKNLNSFRALERSVAYEIQRQTELIQRGEVVMQQTRGWDEAKGETFLQRVKEGEDDYRYFPEPDLPPLVVEPEWVEQVRASLPELPAARCQRFQAQYGLSAYHAELLTADQSIAGYFEEVLLAAPEVPSRTAANWVTGELFGLLNLTGMEIDAAKVSPQNLAGLLRMLAGGEINQNTGKLVLEDMFTTGAAPEVIVTQRSLRQISDPAQIAELVRQVLEAHPAEVQAYLNGKDGLARWLFGQVARLAGGQANPQVLQRELETQLAAWRTEK